MGTGPDGSSRPVSVPRYGIHAGLGRGGPGGADQERRFALVQRTSLPPPTSGAAPPRRSRLGPEAPWRCSVLLALGGVRLLAHGEGEGAAARVEGGRSDAVAAVLLGAEGDGALRPPPPSS